MKSPDFVGFPECVKIAVGKALSSLPPHRSVRAQFRHTALTSSWADKAPDVKAFAWPRVYHARRRQVSLNAGFHLFPRKASSLSAPSQALEPEATDFIVEKLHGSEVSGHPVVGVVPSQHSRKPSSIAVDGPVHAYAEFFLDLPEPAAQGFASRLPADDK